jgi:hypothetical protein
LGVKISLQVKETVCGCQNAVFVDQGTAAILLVKRVSAQPCV